MSPRNAPPTDPNLPIDRTSPIGSKAPAAPTGRSGPTHMAEPDPHASSSGTRSRARNADALRTTMPLSMPAAASPAARRP